MVVGLRLVSCQNYWQKAFDLGYYLALIPYRFCRDANKQKWFYATNRIQFAIHVIISIPNIIQFTIKVVRGNPFEFNNPLYLFYLRVVIAGISCVFNFYYTVWTRRTKFLTVFNFNGDEKHVISEELLLKSQRSSKLNVPEPVPMEKFGQVSAYKAKLTGFWRDKLFTRTTWVTILLYSLSIGQVLLLFFSSCLTYNWDFESFMNVNIKLNKEMLFFSNSSFTSDVSYFSPLRFLGIFFFFYQMFPAYFLDVLFIVTLLYFEDIVQCFLDKVDDPHLKVDQLMEYYGTLKELTFHINESIGPIALEFSITVVPYFCLAFLKFPTFNLSNQIRWGIFIIYYGIFLTKTAEVHSKMGQVYNWFFLQKHFTYCSQTELNVFLNEIKKDDIALKALGQISITKKYLRSIVVTIISYAFIVMQFQQYYVY